MNTPANPAGVFILKSDPEFFIAPLVSFNDKQVIIAKYGFTKKTKHYINYFSPNMGFLAKNALISTTIW